MNRALRTINAILEMGMIKIGRGIHEPLPKLFYELRYNENHDEKGRFTFGKGGGNSKSAVGSSEKSDKKTTETVDKTPKLGYTERVEAAKNMTPFEVETVSHGIMTDFPNLEPDGYRNHYEYGDNHYIFKVRYKGSYIFLEKWEIKSKARGK